jgi:L-cysteine/cystine lyase
MRRSDDLRARIAALMGCDTAEIALTGSTTDGVNAVLGALDLDPGDEVLTSDEEHPGVLAPLAAARERRGVRVRMAPFAELAGAVGEDTKLVACSHVSWISGAVVDAPALAATPALVLLDGAQGLGAVPTRAADLGCDFYAASGQKWLCGPNGLGYLYVREQHCAGLISAWPGYPNLATPERAIDLELHPDARRLGVNFAAAHQVEWALAALDVLEEAGLEDVHSHGTALAACFAAGLGERVTERGESTLVSFEVEDPESAVISLLEEGFVVRNIPGSSYVRVSVGAWSSERELERLLELVTRS